MCMEWIQIEVGSFQWFGWQYHCVYLYISNECYRLSLGYSVHIYTQRDWVVFFRFAFFCSLFGRPMPFSTDPLLSIAAFSPFSLQKKMWQTKEINNKRNEQHKNTQQNVYNAHVWESNVANKITNIKYEMLRHTEMWKEKFGSFFFFLFARRAKLLNWQSG